MQRISLPYDSCPIVAVRIGDRDFRLRVNFAAIDRAKKRQGDAAATVYESERMAAYEGAVEAMGEEAGTFEEFVDHWNAHVTPAMFLAFQEGIRRVYFPRPEPSEADPTLNQSHPEA